MNMAAELNGMVRAGFIREWSKNSAGRYTIDGREYTWNEAYYYVRGALDAFRFVELQVDKWVDG